MEDLSLTEEYLEEAEESGAWSTAEAAFYRGYYYEPELAEEEL